MTNCTHAQSTQAQDVLLNFNHDGQIVVTYRTDLHLGMPDSRFAEEQKSNETICERRRSGLLAARGLS